ncbi:hypothetical protein BaRGS_00035290 [Batillaria attramentaria]|uniref:Uncharacterized protein n=1 Tax=Batillaria attramentaria TaxID=370345 RepID=A0ABD0JFS8_9CAEN
MKVVEILVPAISVELDRIIARNGKRSDNGKPRPILVRFTSRKSKATVMQNRKALKDRAPYQKVYINDDLTLMRSKLLYKCKNTSTVQSVRTTHDGKILCTMKSPPGHTGPAKTVAVETPDDLFHLGVDNISYAEFGVDAYGVPAQALAPSWTLCSDNTGANDDNNDASTPRPYDNIPVNDLLVGGVYIPPEGSRYGSVDTFDNLETQLVENLQRNDYLVLLMVKDFFVSPFDALLSDVHCPVSLTLSLGEINIDTSGDATVDTPPDAGPPVDRDDTQPPDRIRRWDSGKADAYATNLATRDNQALNDLIDSNADPNAINTRLVSILLDTARNTLARVRHAPAASAADPKTNKLGSMRSAEQRDVRT